MWNPCRKHSRILPRTSARLGFTLVELLVVIAIMALLAGLLLPALVGAQARARAVSCLNNQRQLALSFLLYCDEHSETFPTAAAISALGAHPEDWLWWQLQPDGTGQAVMRSGEGSVLAPYLGGYRSSYFRCPADRDALARELAWKRDMSQELYTYSYSLNAHSERGMASYFSKDRSMLFRNKISAVVNPSQKIMLAEEKGSPKDGPGTAFIDDGRWQPLGYALTMRHQGKAIVAFADGRAQAVPRAFAESNRPEHFDPFY